jgi:peroxiredoxin (alkyl hydroperoxide reductase subunit C)
MGELKPGCVAPAKGVIAPKAPDEATGTPVAAGKEERMGVMVGREAPDFEANGFHKDGFATFRLSDYRGKWVVLCFYPGDFTFV